MTINLTPELEELIEQKVASGEFASREAVIEEALRLLSNRQPPAEAPSASQRRLTNLQALFEEADRDPPPRATPLPDEAFDRKKLYDE